MKPDRWGIKDGMCHLWWWWKPDEHHWRDLSTDGGNHPVSRCGQSAEYHDVQWLERHLDALPDDVILCPHCAPLRVTMVE